MPKQILIADDEPTVVALAKQKLMGLGYGVLTARNGKEALDLIQKGGIDLIVTDVVMPVMDGVDLYKEVKKEPRFAHIPIVIITDSKIFRDSFQTLGVEHFLPKPLDGEKLLHKVDYIFCCEELERKNRQVLILGTDAESIHDMGMILEGNKFVVGKGMDPIEFISNCLILMPKIALVDIMVRGDVPAKEVIRGLKCFSRLRDTKILVFTHFDPEDIASMQGIEELREAKNICIDAGASEYIGRFTPATFWDSVKGYFD
ncbi:MAG: response regulator [Candidatus Omnitrophica bacterium]|nr:response regulator [Candidatus Omnitrophota bacterium]